MNIEEIKTTIYRAQGKKEVLSEQLQVKENALEILNKRLPAIEQAQLLIQETARETQAQLEHYLQDIVQTGIDLCFPKQYTFHSVFENKRGKTECDIFLKNQRGSKFYPLDNNGGGLGDVVAFALRIACWSISDTDNIIVIDEPAKFVDESLRPFFGELLKTLSTKLNLQILMVSHDQEFINCADKVFVVKKNKGISQVTERA